MSDHADTARRFCELHKSERPPPLASRLDRGNVRREWAIIHAAEPGEISWTSA
jgi:hypothetical protein